MPVGMRWSKNQGRWVKDDEFRENYYDGFDDKSWGLMISYWRYYPDKLLDLLEADNPRYNLELIQRLILRLYARYWKVFATGSRGLTKTYCTILGRMVMGLLYPGVITRYVPPTQEQGAQLAKAAYAEIEKQYPHLAEYWTLVSASKDNFEIKSVCGSIFSINAMRGDTCNAVIAEEVAQVDKGKAFDHQNFQSAILPSVRGERKVNRATDPFFPQFQKMYITSAGTTFNEAFGYRVNILNEMWDGENSYALDIPFQVSLLSGLRKIEQIEDLKKQLSADTWLREMESIWTGTSENPIIRDLVLNQARNLQHMEESHCGLPDVFYVIGYDVSYADGAKNAKCATAVIKCEKQRVDFKKDRYMKSLVYVFDNPPPPTTAHQARALKTLWRRFSNEMSEPTYIAIDAWQYGKGVVEALHDDLGDGLPPLCCMNHEFPELEKRNAVPIIYAVKATGGAGGGVHDTDADMIRYAEVEFEQGNVRLLTSNVVEGVEAYKRLHNIKDDELDVIIARPYNKTRELMGQIGNLKKVAAGFNLKEERIRKSIQRDMWSALKYALRVCSILEHQNLIVDKDQKSVWANEIDAVVLGVTNAVPTGTFIGFGAIPAGTMGRTLGRIGGNRN